MGDRPESDIADTAGVAVFLEAQDGCFHVAGDIKNNFLKRVRAPTNRGPAFRYDSRDRSH